MAPAKVRSTSLGIWHWQPEPAFQVGPGCRGPGVADWKLLLVVPGPTSRAAGGGPGSGSQIQAGRDIPRFVSASTGIEFRESRPDMADHRDFGS